MSKPSKKSTPLATRQTQPPARSAGSNTGIIVAIVAALVVVAGLVAILATRGGDDSAASQPAASDPVGGSTATTAPPSGTPIVYGEVTVTGDPVPPTPEGGQPPIGSAVPTISGTDYFGNPMTIEPGSGPLMIVVLAHWCPHCNAEIPRIIEWADEGGVPEGLDIVAISTAVTETRPNFPPAEWLQGKQWRWPALADSDTFAAAEAVGTTSFPTVVIVGADGTVAGSWSGESSVEEIDARVDAALGLS
jgi:thiol-disulfide isomerase/thioredoxin